MGIYPIIVLITYGALMDKPTKMLRVMYLEKDVDYPVGAGVYAEVLAAVNRARRAEVNGEAVDFVEFECIGPDGAAIRTAIDSGEVIGLIELPFIEPPRVQGVRGTPDLSRLQ